MKKTVAGSDRVSSCKRLYYYLYPHFTLISPPHSPLTSSVFALYYVLLFLYLSLYFLHLKI